MRDEVLESLRVLARKEQERARSAQAPIAVPADTVINIIEEVRRLREAARWFQPLKAALRPFANVPAHGASGGPLVSGQCWYEDGSSGYGDKTGREVPKAILKAKWFRDARDTLLAVESPGRPVQGSTPPEGFTPWDGGGCPVEEGTIVECLLSNDTLCGPRRAGSFFWGRSNDRDDWVVSFKVHKPTTPDLRTVAGGGVLKLKYGRMGKTRDGEIVGPIGCSHLTNFPFWASEKTFNEFGFESCQAKPGDRNAPQTEQDIVELLPEEAP